MKKAFTLTAPPPLDRTETWIVSKSLQDGLALSVTRTVSVYVPGVVGVQVNTPVEELIDAPAGKPASSEKVRVWPASGSVAVAVNVNRFPSVTVLFPIVSSTGHWF